MAVAQDIIPPTIVELDYSEFVKLSTLGAGFFVYGLVTDDDSGVDDVRVNIIGPAGFRPINESMIHYGGGVYWYDLTISLSGTYTFYIWAIDTAGNTVLSETYDIYVLTGNFDYLHINDDNTEGPWDGTEEHPFQHINDGIAVVNQSGIIFVHEGFYQENVRIENQQFSLIGEDKETTVIDGSGSGSGIAIVRTTNVVIEGFTIRNCRSGITLGYGTSSCTISNCIISNNDAGIRTTAMFAEENMVYHNNFF